MSDKLKSEVSSSRPRDEHGHFVSAPDPKKEKTVLAKFLASHTGNYKNEDDLLDIHVGNPLRRVVELLQEIKKQKAFSFTLKGSLGVAGVVLVLGVFGIFGGGKLLCDKGTQTHIGTIKSLNVKEIHAKSVPFLSYLLDLIAPPQKEIKNRTVLIKGNENVIYLPFNENIDLSKFVNLEVLATGNYDICSESLTINDPNGVEALVRNPLPAP